MSYLYPRARSRASTGFKLSALVIALGVLAAAACGDNETTSAGEPADAGSGAEPDDAGGARPPFDLEGCVVSVLATDCGGGLPVPHPVELLNAKTGEPLAGFKTMSAPGGKYTFKNVPGDVEIAVHAIGVGPTTESGSTYDTIAFYDRDSGDNLLRVSTVGTAGLVPMVAGFKVADDKVALSGAVYQVDDHGKRIGAVGCAQIFVDDQAHPAERFDQRYNASGGLPTTLGKLDKTLAGSGRFYFGNAEKGEHTLKVSLDNGKTFIAEHTVFLSRAREDAASPFKSLLYLVGIDVKGKNPTPPGCPSEEAM